MTGTTRTPRRRRGSVFQQHAVAEIDLKSVVEKVPIFAEAPSAFVDSLVAALKATAVDPATYIMKEGDDGDEMYIVSRGEVEILVGPDEISVARLGPGSFFGEIALLKDAKRNASVRTIDECEVCSLSKEAFERVLQGQDAVRENIMRIAFGRDRAKEVVRKVPIFKDCDDTFMDRLVRKLKPEVLKDGDYVMREGDTGSEMYILYKGEVEVIAGAENKVLAKLGEGAFFGEIALLKNAKRWVSRLARLVWGERERGEGG
jgi:CRP-like cAMP-binding protein